MSLYTKYNFFNLLSCPCSFDITKPLHDVIAHVYQIEKKQERIHEFSKEDVDKTKTHKNTKFRRKARAIHSERVYHRTRPRIRLSEQRIGESEVNENSEVVETV